MTTPGTPPPADIRAPLPAAGLFGRARRWLSSTPPPSARPGHAHDASRRADEDSGDWAQLQRALGGDTLAADALVRGLGRSGLRLAQQMLRSREAAEDVVQEALLRLWRQPPQDRGSARLSTWFATVVLNLCRDQLTHQQRETSTDPELLVAWADGAAPEGLPSLGDGGAADPGRRLDARSRQRRIAEAVAGLPPRQRLAVALWAYADAPVEEIARQLEIETNAAHQLLHRARQGLRQRLGADLSE